MFDIANIGFYKLKLPPKKFYIPKKRVRKPNTCQICRKKVCECYDVFRYRKNY